MLFLLYRARFWYNSCRLSGVVPAWISLLVSFHLGDVHLYILPITPTYHIRTNYDPHLDINHNVQSYISLEVCTDHCAMPAPRILSLLPSFIKLNHYYCQYHHHFHFLLYFLTKETSKVLVEPNSLTLSPWVNLSPNLFLRDTFGCPSRESFFLENNQPQGNNLSEELFCFCSNPWKHSC